MTQVDSKPPKTIVRKSNPNESEASKAKIEKSVRIACMAASEIEIDYLVPLQGELKTLSEESYIRLRSSIIELGFSFPIQAWRHKGSFFIIDAHQRVSTLKRMRDEGYLIPKLPVAWVDADDEQQAARKLLAAASQYGEVTEKGLFEFMNKFSINMDEMFAKFQFPEIDFPEFKTDFYPDEDDDSEGNKLYTDKIQTPIYEPKGEKPKISDLYDLKKANELIEKINASHLPKEEKIFLTFAAYRHIVFNYENIAEYYAHSSPPMQDNMEKSALVIIDFNKAIENGFAVLTEKIAKAYPDTPEGEAEKPSHDRGSLLRLSKTSHADLEDLIDNVADLFASSFDRAAVLRDSLEMVQLHKENKPLPASNGVKILLDRWYRSIENGKPDYSVYSEPFYLADIWTCWVAYSRSSVKAIIDPKALVDNSLESRIDKKGLIVDAGCGIAYTTAALAEIFPEARVVGTNLEGTWQYKLAKKMAPGAGFEVAKGVSELNGVELFFASEYFEHFENPIDHLDTVVRICSPRFFVIANGFNGISIGHFPNYILGKGRITNRDMSKYFWKHLRELGYEKIEAKIWNNRPSIWERVTK